MALCSGPPITCSIPLPRPFQGCVPCLQHSAPSSLCSGVTHARILSQPPCNHSTPPPSASALSSPSLCLMIFPLHSLPPDIVHLSVSLSASYPHPPKCSREQGLGQFIPTFIPLYHTVWHIVSVKYRFAE